MPPAKQPSQKKSIYKTTPKIKGHKTIGVNTSDQALPRLVQSGDTLGVLEEQALQEAAVNKATRKARSSKLAMVESLAQDTTADMHDKASSLRAILEGAAPDDAQAIRKLLDIQDTDLSCSEVGNELVSTDDELVSNWRIGEYPYKYLLSRKRYEQDKYKLQVELLKLQAWVKDSKQRVVILFEGRDAAGKGGAITRFMEHLNPRGARVVALEKPTEVERGQWYFQRYVQHLPTAGEIVLFDRSWYNRAGVERVMGFCSDEEYHEFMHQAPDFERQLVRSGIHVFKFWFSVSRKEQQRRFKERQSHPLK